MRGSAALAAISTLCALALAGCGNGKVIGSGPLPTASPAPVKVTAEFKIPTANSGPAAITSAPDGFLYFTENTASKIGQSSTAGSIKEISTKTAAAGPYGIIVGPNGLIWFTEQSAHAIGTLGSFAASAVTEYAVPWANARPTLLTVGAAENTMYFTDPGNSALGEITTSGTVSGPFPTLTPNANPLGVAVGPDNGIWFCENGVDKIGHLNTATNTVDREFQLTGLNPTTIVQGSDGAMWFTENDPAGPKLGRLTTTGVLNEYPLKGAKSAVGLAVDAFGNFTVTDQANDAIGVFTVNTLGYVEYPVPTASANPTWVTIGPDSRMYFTETSANQIGQFS